MIKKITKLKSKDDQISFISIVSTGQSSKTINLGCSNPNKQTQPTQPQLPPPSTMANNALLFFSFSLLFIISSAIASSSDEPFIVAHKKATLKRLKSGAERVLVSIDIYNEGSATAYDVSLTDDSWPEDAFDIIDGKTSSSWERLDVGALVSHSFELEAKVKGKFQGSPAVIKYRVPTKAALQEAFSTPIFPLDILEDRPPEAKFEGKLLAKYGSQVSVITIVGLFVYLVASPSSAAKASKKKR
ncbi:Translocon-associated protein subunit beta [Bienertia sinuspersici]